MTRNEAILVAKKLKALAEKSSGGERDAALGKLRSFCQKYELDAEEFSTDQIKVSISYQSEHEKQLLSNILCMVMESDQVKGKITNQAYSFSCTPRQLENIKDAFAYYKKAMNEYIDSFLVALVTKNQIINPRKNEQGFQFDQMSEEERRQYDEEFLKDLKEKGEEPPKNEPPPQQSEPTPPPAQSESEVKRNERIQKMLFVVDVPRWTPKPKPKLFLS